MRVLLVRPAQDDDRDARALQALDIDTVSDPYLEVAPSRDADAPARVRRLLDDLTPDTWLVVTSAAGPRAVAAIAPDARIPEHVHCAAVGPTSADALHQLGAAGVLTPAAATGSALADLLCEMQPGRAVLPQGDRALPVVAERLTEAGWEVRPYVVYSTQTIAEPPNSVEALLAGAFDVVVVRSPSAVQALNHFAPDLRTPVVCAGPTTAAAAARLGLTIAAESPDSTAEAIARTIDSLRGGTITP